MVRNGAQGRRHERERPYTKRLAGMYTSAGQLGIGATASPRLKKAAKKLLRAHP